MRQELERAADVLIDCGLAMGGRWGDRWPSDLGPADAVPIAGLMARAALRPISPVLVGDQATAGAVEARAEAEGMDIAAEILAAEHYFLDADTDPLKAPSLPPRPEPCPTSRLIVFGAPPAVGPWIGAKGQGWAAGRTLPALLLLGADRGVVWLGLLGGGGTAPALGATWVLDPSTAERSEWAAVDRLIGVLDWGAWTTAPRAPRNIRRRVQRAVASHIAEVPPVHVIDMQQRAPRLVVDRPDRSGRTIRGYERRAHWHRYRVGVDVRRDENLGVTWEYRLHRLAPSLVLGGPEDDRPVVWRMPRQLEQKGGG